MSNTDFEIRQHFSFESARHLPQLPSSHPCSRIHGHSFKVTLRLKGPLNPQLDWLLDFNEVNQLVQPIISELDHRLLNEIPGLQNPTTEKLCQWLFQRLVKTLPTLVQVIISETEKSEVRYPFL